MLHNLKYRKLWNLHEDELLTEIVARHNAKRWKQIASEYQILSNTERTAKQCRERWINHLDPRLCEPELLQKHIEKLFSLQLSMPNKWSKISKEFPGISKNSIKNFYYSTIRRNTRRFNKAEPVWLRIEDQISRLYGLSEIRVFLTLGKNYSKVELALKKQALAQKLVLQLGGTSEDAGRTEKPAFEISSSGVSLASIFEHLMVNGGRIDDEDFDVEVYLQQDF